jgi:hypothetical protein
MVLYSMIWYGIEKAYLGVLVSMSICLSIYLHVLIKPFSCLLSR